MQKAKPSSSAPPYSGALGAGGKFRKPPVSRKRPSTPYDRPPLATQTNKAADSQDGAGAGGWLSKLVVNPARLIVGGATRMLPSFFSKPDSSSADEYDDVSPSDSDDQDVDANANACGEAKHALELGASRWSGDAGPTNKVDKLKGILEHNDVEQDQTKKLSGDLDLDKIENMLKGKQFSRDESNRLMEILNSRLVDVSNAEEEKKEYDMETAVLETPKPCLQSNIQDEVGASPIDIAKAYMGNRTSQLGFTSYNITSSKDERLEQHSDLFPSKPHILTPSSKSSTCWPGAMVQDHRSYLTPQAPKGRYGLRNGPPTPYSRSIFSRNKPKLTQLHADSRSSPITFQQSPTPNYGQMKTSSDVMDGGYGSVGPIRRVRNKFVSEPQSEKRNNPYSTQIASSPNVSRTFVPVFQKNPETGGTSCTSNPGQTLKIESTPTGPSNEMVRKILEQLDRHKPTPKEKAHELKLATEWKKSPSQNTILMPKENNVLTTLTGSNLPKSGVLKETDEGSVKGMPYLARTSNASTKTFSSVDNGGAGPSFGFRNIGVADESKQKAPVTNIKELDNQINGQDLTRKRQPQPILKPITFKRPDPQHVISSDNGRGFTFQFSGAASSASEPPTPSIMPSFPTIGTAQTNELPPIPTYSFGTKKSGDRIVFSFPSTSTGLVDDGVSDLKFNFGSDKRRVTFRSIKSDVIVMK